MPNKLMSLEFEKKKKLLSGKKHKNRHTHQHYLILDYGFALFYQFDMGLCHT